ncbi:hypothetical protein RIdsm_05390 (plasmid) [Roseovarius indicus]|uniref:Uncharacterized protein n=2 Tax=Roseovarius indicus TaxID=540747 RepID=A0A0T5NUR0_9RHOB|nr:hypothetical protein [Roseovarius indicus]KRS12680.1 hypothetical protein XM52_28105 [Roseovarius indicus]QEW29545.1 hypothetical protein RIdsm_05390 [Roseovarius indicus]SFE85139.1 hypothetical protein SAMN04488031_12818 [Roseovarius indicus]
MQHSTKSMSTSETGSSPSLLEIVMRALEATGRIPTTQPETGFPDAFTADRVTDFYVEELNGGWVSTVRFRDIPDGLPNALGSPDIMPYREPRDAFLHGAGILCEIVTGSRALPFTMVRAPG